MGESQEEGSHSHAQNRMRLSLAESCHAKATVLRILGMVVDGG